MAPRIATPVTRRPSGRTAMTATAWGLPAGRESLGGQGDGNAQHDVAGCVERFRAARHHGHVRLRRALLPVLFPPPPALADVVAVGAGNVERPGTDRLLPRDPAHG